MSTETTSSQLADSARILVSTHGKHIHLLSLPPSPSTDLRLVSSLELDQQPSYSLRHPHIPGLIYVSAWIPDLIFLVQVRGDELIKLGETEAGGGGPTYFVMTPDRKSLLVANYRSGAVTRISINPQTGHFDLPHPPAKDILQLPSKAAGPARSRRLEVRQDSAHAHQIIPIPAATSSSASTRAAEEYLVCDLGSDKIYVVTYSEESGWDVVSVYETTPGYGPRHAAIKTISSSPAASTVRPDEPEVAELAVYVVNELSCMITGHRVLRNPTRLSTPFFTPISTLPPVDHVSGTGSKIDLEGYTPQDPMETIACAILLVPSSSNAGTDSQELLVTNRNLPLEISPERDPWSVFPLGPSGEIDGPGRFYFGAGRHLRGVGLEKRDPARLLIASREGDGFTLYQQSKDKREETGGWEELGRGLLQDEKEIELPLAIDWL